MKNQIIINYPCESKKSCFPVNLSLSAGTYRIELWGGQGGNLTHGELGGGGGYARANFKFTESKNLFFFIGASGFEGASNGLTGCSFNGGGSGTFGGTQLSAAAGGGASDVRTELSLDSRLLVAGGGSGASIHFSGSNNHGACGGGINGRDGEDAFGGGTYHSGGKGGNGSIGGEGLQKGKFGFGGNQTNGDHFGSGGGGGWYGGGSGSIYGSAGGGGSGFADQSLKDSELISGCELIPDFYGESYTIGNHGNGGARITPIFDLCLKSHFCKFGAFYTLNAFALSFVLVSF